MLFNSTSFLIFFFIFIGLYFTYGRRNITTRNLLIVISSYIFYSFWDWRFTFLLLSSSLIDFKIGCLLQNEKVQSKRKNLLIVSVFCNLGVLFLFKYFNFFSESLNELLINLGASKFFSQAKIILPVGISFYTFQSLGYAIDVYRKKTTCVDKLVPFLAYVSFFPQLVAGPIERSTNLIPQFLSSRKISNEFIYIGFNLIILGLFKKVVIADNLAPLVDMVYGQNINTGPIILFATIAFGIQIYCDFSGYSDIARGIAYILGFKLMINFNLPYFSTTPKEFWRRWHISLSSWFRDYVYIPLGGNKIGKSKTMRNLVITMLLAGIWHGAGWNFILWGLWHGLMLSLFSNFEPKNFVTKTLGWFLTMIIVFYGWLLFRCNSIEQIVNFTLNIGANNFPNWFNDYLFTLLLFGLVFFILQLWKKITSELCPAINLNIFLNSLVVAIKIYLIVLFWDSNGSHFIYFQF